MNKQLKIFSFPDRNPEYLQLQIDSYNKHMKNENTELVMINASIDHEDEINQICKNNNVNCIKFTGEKNGNFNSYYVRQFHWFRDEIQKKSNDYILLMHSDMFFINNLNFQDLMNKYKICYNPQYRNQFTGHPDISYSYIWDGIILFDSQYFNENQLTDYFNWEYIRPITDMGGMMKEFLAVIKNMNIHNYFEFWNYGGKNGNIINTHLNGNIRYFIDEVNYKFEGRQPNLINRSFDYENEKSNYISYYIDKFKQIKKVFIEPFNISEQINFDIIQTFETDIENGFMLHFKSGSAVQDFNASSIKLKAIEKIIKRDL